MRITPLDVRKQEFRRAVRGFDCDEVRAFLNTLADEYETVLIDNKQLRERVLGQDDKIKEYKHLERTLRDTLMTAERLTQDTRERAAKEGDLIIEDARLQAKRILEECRVRTEELRGELTGLRKEKETYLARFKTLAETQIQFVESHRSDFDDLDRRLVGMVDEVIEGLGAKAAASAEAAVEHRVTTSWPAREASPVPAAPEPLPEPAPQPASYPSAPGDEVDQWRDYLPEVDGRETAPAYATAPEPEQAPAAAPAESAPTAEPRQPAPVAELPAPEQTAPAAASAPVAPEARPEPARPEVVAAPYRAPINPWQSGSWGGESGRPAAQVDPRNAEVKLAAMGIPMPSRSRSDGTDEAVAALIEDAKPEPTSVW